ncbi:MAG: ATP-binding protein [Granulosicoccaceae bacterium]
MKLRTQMLMVGALALAVPIIAWQSVKQLDTSLKQSRIDVQNLKVANARIALAEAGQLQALLDSSSDAIVEQDLFAQDARYPLFIDGYDDDWRNLTAEATQYGTFDEFSISPSAEEQSLSLRLAQYRQSVFLFITIADDAIVYHKPPRLVFDAGEDENPDENQMLINGDSVELLVLYPGETPTHYLFRAIAPGILAPVLGSNIHTHHASAERLVPNSLRNKHQGAAVHNANAYWVATGRGVQLEVRLPSPPLGTRIAVAYRDIDVAGDAPVSVMGDFNPERLRSFRWRSASVNYRALYRTTVVASDRLAPLVTAGVRARLYDKRGRLVADVNSLYELDQLDEEVNPASGGLLNAVLFRLFSYFVTDVPTDVSFNSSMSRRQAVNFHLDAESIESLGTDPQTTLYNTADNDRVLGTVQSIGGDTPNGYLLFESNEDPRTTYAGSRLARLFSLLTLVSVLTGGMLFVYATVLSLRIRKLSQQADDAVSKDGKVVGLSQSTAKDEIGDLSRNLSSLLSRSANYTHYLEALSSRLSHELRTPLSVVKTSIENLDRDQLDPQSLTLIDRANSGADQLGSIIRALVESTRLEQTVQQTQMERIDLSDWFDAQLQRYQLIYPNKAITMDNSIDKPYPYQASPELLEQAMDKLVANAVGFARDGRVRLLLHATDADTAVALTVANKGEPIVEEKLSQLFDPMFSERVEPDGELHLGLGLYIVHMIAEAHAGNAFAANSSPEVWFGFKLPAV